MPKNPEKTLNNPEETRDIVNSKIMPHEALKDIFLVLLCNELVRIVFPESSEAMARSLVAKIKGTTLDDKTQKTIETAKSWTTSHIDKFKKCKDYEAIQKYCQERGLGFALGKVNFNEIITNVFDPSAGVGDEEKIQ